MDSIIKNFEVFVSCLIFSMRQKIEEEYMIFFLHWLVIDVVVYWKDMT